MCSGPHDDHQNQDDSAPQRAPAFGQVEIYPDDRNYYRSLNYVDPLVGGRIQVPLSPKLLATIMGDVGGWGAGSQLDYQIVGDLSYKIKPKWAMDVAWRYLFVDYAKTHIYTQTAESGIVLGVTYALK